MNFIARYQFKETDSKIEVKIQDLKTHLLNVSRLSESYGAKIKCSKFMQLAGLLHDIGKYSPDFMTYINRKKGLEMEPTSHSKGADASREKVDHGVYGAKYIFEKNHKEGGYSAITAELLLLICCYHHGGLPSLVNHSGKAAAIERISKITTAEMDTVFRTFEAEVNINVDELFTEAVKEIEAVICRLNKRKLTEDSLFVYNLLIKLFYSMLIDADRVDSMCFEVDEREWEKYVGQRGNRIQKYIEYQRNIEAVYTDFHNQRAGSINTKNVNDIRNAIADECLAAGAKSGGVYRLTVPTGGGKTLASMRYALEHTIKNNKERIFYFLPFTTITSQNAAVFRDALGETCDLLEHHANVLDKHKSEEYRLLTTRWENDVVVSTTVQFLNTFYASGTQDARRLHNMLHSVIIFDEVQTIPINCMNLFRSAVLFLSEFMDATVVLCTATQPPDTERSLYPIFKSQIRELTSNTEAKFTALRRVKVVDETRVKPYLYDGMADYIIDKKKDVKSLLVVLNKVKSVRQVYEALRDKGLEGITLFHLSSSMAPVHKGVVLEEMQRALKSGESLVCVSTATIEAGVDISFEAAIRNLTKLDSIAQTAGRVNRNGEMELGYCYVINLNEGSYSHLTEIDIGGKKSRTVLEEYEDVLFPEVINSYFRDFYSDQEIFRQFNYPYKNRDLYDLLTTTPNASWNGYMNEEGQDYPLCFCIQFAEAAEAFEVIKGLTRSLIVPYKEGENVIDKMLELSSYAPINIKKELLDRAKGYTINVYDYMIEELRDKGAILFCESLGVYLLAKSFYDKEIGLVMEAKIEIV